jgi:hypothetical protein
MPNNHLLAEHRLAHLKRKMARNQEFKDDYITFMNDTLSKGHAEEVPESEIHQASGRIWYLPHHGVSSAEEEDESCI